MGEPGRHFKLLYVRKRRTTTTTHTTNQAGHTFRPACHAFRQSPLTRDDTNGQAKRPTTWFIVTCARVDKHGVVEVPFLIYIYIYISCRQSIGRYASGISAA